LDSTRRFLRVTGKSAGNRFLRLLQCSGNWLEDTPPVNAIFAVLPLLLARYLLPALLNRAVLKRLAFTPLVAANEKAAFWVYEAATVLIVLVPLLLRIEPGSAWFVAGLPLYCLGLALYAISVINYARPNGNGMSESGLYRLSRNPMYVSFFLSYLKISLLASSWILFALIVVYQASAHWMILSEERWCLRAFGEGYAEYMKKVGRYLYKCKHLFAQTMEYFSFLC
jgi:protein-S-isoprenylcysteine O-methyltransferase Ste14